MLIPSYWWITGPHHHYVCYDCISHLLIGPSLKMEWQDCWFLLVGESGEWLPRHSNIWMIGDEIVEFTYDRERNRLLGHIVLKQMPHAMVDFLLSIYTGRHENADYVSHMLHLGYNIVFSLSLVKWVDNPVLIERGLWADMDHTPNNCFFVWLCVCLLAWLFVWKFAWWCWAIFGCMIDFVKAEGQVVVLNNLADRCS